MDRRVIRSNNFAK